MKPTENRLGNIVCLVDRSKEIHLPIHLAPMFVWIIEPFETTVRPIEYLPKPYMDSPEYKRNNSDITGIPLTQEWLIKLGFESNQDEHEEEWFHKDEELFGLKEDVLNENWKEKSPTWAHIWDNAFTAAPCNYVHELQNLYFALTGKELEVK